MTELPDYSRLLLKVEADLHRRGWDQDPFLALLSEPRPGRLTLIPVSAVQNPPGAFLLWASQRALESDEFGPSALNDCEGEFRGYAFVCEGWSVMSDQISDEERRELRNSGRGYADHQAAKELRTIGAVDVFGRIHFVKRIRGEKPSYAHSQDGSGEDFEGRIPEALRRMALVTARAMPGGGEYATLLDKLVIPGFERH